MIELVGTLLGGLGLFLLAVSMITDGLKLAAGDALREVLARSTSTRLRGVASGILVTGVVQSSSAVTVATIGFVNAGLLTLVQSLGIIYGANIGTTMTGWLVAAIGFKFSIEVIALPMIGLGMAARLLGKATRAGALGEALAGFGLFFIGIDVLREAFQGVSASLDIAALSADTAFGILLYVAFGFLATLVTQSSSAAIALTLTAATGGVLGIDAAAAMVIGANVGTTSTAMLSVIGATANARRVAAAHVMFNVLTGGVALLLLPLLLLLVDLTGKTLGLADVPAVSLALFHTVFNVLGVLIMLPLTNWLARFLAARFVTPAEVLSKPLYLDRTVAVAPALGLDALALELARIADMSRELAIDAVRAPQMKTEELEYRSQAVNALTDHVEAFVGILERDRLSKGMSERLLQLLRVNTYLEEVDHLAHEVATHYGDIQSLCVGDAATLIEEYRTSVTEYLASADPAGEDFDAEALKMEYEQLHENWHDLKTMLLDAASRKVLPIARLNVGIERLRACLRMAEQTMKASSRLHAVTLSEDDEDQDEPTAEEPVSDAA